MEEKKKEAGEIRLLTADEIECRVGMISEKGLSLLLYKDARADMKILDETFGMMNWRRGHVKIGESLFCKVDLWDADKKEWVFKMDVGTESNMEKEKGQASDSFKRACVSVGIGRELYSAPFIWIPAGRVNLVPKGDKYVTYDRFFVKEISYTPGREIAGLTIVNQDGVVVYSTNGKSKVYELPPKEDKEKSAVAERVTAINTELERTGVALDKVLERYGVSSIEEMSPEIYGRAISSLKRTKAKVA